MLDAPGGTVSVVRRWVFPTLRIVIALAIAVALVKLAFFGDAASTEATGQVPTAQLSDPEVEVARGTVRNDVVLQGTVSADPAVASRATLTGEVREVTVKVGDQVGGDTVVARIRAETANADGTPLVRWATVTAGASGTVSALTALVGQQVAVGDTLASIAPPTFSVNAAIAPEQQYRLLQMPGEAQVLVTGGPGEFACGGLGITTQLQTVGESGAGASGDGATSGATLHCSVPGDVTVFSGLGARVTIPAGVADDVLVLPTTAVEGQAGVGTVFRPSADGGDPEPVSVTLGMTDGQQVEITSGLDEGDVVLQFVPGAPALQEGCTDLGDGQIVCEG